VPVPIPVYVVEDLATHQPEVLAACTAVATPRQCVPATATQAGARIVAGTAPHTYRVDVLRDGQWLSRYLVFSEVDAPAERARALGMTVGVLAVGDSQSPPPAEAAKKPEVPAHKDTPVAREPVAPEAPEESAEPAAAPVTVHVELAGRVGSGVDSPRVGAGANAVFLRRGFPLGVFVTGTWLGSSSTKLEVTSRWLSGGGGLVAVIVPSDGFLLDARAAYLREQWHVVASATDELPEDAATRSYNSLELEVGAAAQLVDPLHLRLGAGLRTSPAQQVRVAGRALGENPSPAPYASLGILLRF